MRRLMTLFSLAVSICYIISLNACGPTPTPIPPSMTTVFLVRHAEYCQPDVDPSCNPSDPDPDLGSIGNQRAQELVHVLGKANVEAVYSTNTNRTRGTAQPLADMLEIEPSIYSVPHEVADQVLSDHSGGAVLIVGHQPTVPAIVDALGGHGDRCAITTDEFDNLCMVTIHESGRVGTIRLQYGESSLPDSGRGANITIEIRSGTTDGSVLATVSSLVPASVSTGAQPLGYFELSEPLDITPGNTYVIDWVSPDPAILTWMVAEGDPYSGGMAFGCSGIAIPDEDFAFTTHGTVLPLRPDQESDSETGKSRSCGTPSSGNLLQSFTPSTSSLAAVDLRLRAGGDFPSEPDFEMTTVLLIRHAERANDSLTNDGWIRAEQLAHVTLKAGISAVYATTAARTQQTVRRLADLRGLEALTYTNTDALAQKILTEHKGKVILVAGHQPTVPEIISELGGDSDACAIGAEYDNLCIVTINGNGEANVANLQYGEPSPALAPSPDLVVTDLEMTGPAIADPIQEKIRIPIRAVITNQGDEQAGSFNIAIEQSWNEVTFHSVCFRDR